jgi:hypothetical protein
MARRRAPARCVHAAPPRRKLWGKIVAPIEISTQDVAALVYGRFLDPKDQNDRVEIGEALVRWVR